MASKLKAVTGHAPIKLIAVILFAILIPSVLVTALGLLAVFQADAFVEDRFTGPLRSRAEDLHRRLEGEWRSRLELYSGWLKDAHRRLAHLGDLRGRAFIRDILVARPGGLDLVPDPPPRDLWSPAAPEELRELNRLEMIEKDIPGALAECRRLLGTSREDGVLVEALLAAARLSHRQGARDESIQHLREALERFGNTIDLTGMVHSVPILVSIAEIEREQGQAARAKETAREATRELERHAPFLDSGTRAFFRAKLAALGELPAPGPAESPEPAPEGGKKAGSRLFTQAHLASLEPLLARPGGGGSPGAGWPEVHVSLPGAGDVDIVGFPSEGGEVITHLALDRDALSRDVEAASTEIGLPAGGLQLCQPGAAPSRGSRDVLILSRRLPPPLGNLEMRYFAGEGVLPEGFRAFDFISLAAFTWAVIVLVLTILVGVLFTLRSVLREMRTARLKSDFVSFISHELKTPLTAIRMFTETMLAGRIESEEERRMCLQMIDSESERLAKLIEQVLEFSRIEKQQKEFRFTTCDMEAVVREAVRIFQEHNRMDPREIEVNSAQHISRIKMDRTAMIELMLNLLSNAAKYSPRDRHVVINLRESIDDISVEVVDRGIGIRKRDQKKIFEKFYRADDYLTREVEGTGLGLAFAKYIARVHNGEIKVSSQVNTGSTFTLQIRKTHVLAE